MDRICKQCHRVMWGRSFGELCRCPRKSIEQLQAELEETKRKWSKEIEDLDQKHDQFMREQRAKINTDFPQLENTRFNPFVQRQAPTPEPQQRQTYRVNNTYCSNPGCFTKLRNKYSSICSYCKAKQGYYK